MSSETLKIISLIQSAGPIEGRKKFQKIVYILQNENVDFGKNFKYANYGPYSVDLQLELDLLVKNKVFEEVSERGGYIYSFNKENVYHPLGEINPEIQSKSNLINYLNNTSSQELELVATIYFLKNKGEEYSNDEIVRKKIAYLKPHLEDKITEAYSIYEKIKNHEIN